MCSIAIFDLNSDTIEIIFHSVQLLSTNHQKNLQWKPMKQICLNLGIPNLKKKYLLHFLKANLKVASGATPFQIELMNVAQASQSKEMDKSDIEMTT